MALLYNGTQINTIMPKYESDHSLQVGPITHLLGAKVTCIGLGNTYTRPLGYVVIWVQVDEVQGYDKDKIALLILDISNFAARVPVILGTPTISCIVNVMKEKEIDALATPWVNARVAHVLWVRRMTAIKVGDGAAEECSSDDYNQVMFTQNIETIEAFSSYIVPVKAEKAYTRGCINVMAQALQTEDGSLLQGLTVQNMYTELWQGSKKAVMMVRNTMVYLQKKALVAKAVLATPLPKSSVGAQLQEGENEPQDPCAPKLTVRQWHGKLFDELNLSGLDSWPPEMADAAHQLLAKYHYVFSLDPAELGCTHSTEHMIKVMDDTPFQEQFKHISLSLAEEV